MATSKLVNELLHTFSENKESNENSNDGSTDELRLISASPPRINRLVRQYSSELELSDNNFSSDENQDSALPLDSDMNDIENKEALNDIQFGAKIPETIKQQINSIATTKNGFVKIDASIISITCDLLVVGYARENFDIEYILPDVIIKLFQNYYPKSMLICANTNVMSVQSGGENPFIFVVSKRDWTLCKFTQLIYCSTEIVSLKQVPPQTLQNVIEYLSHHKGIQPDPLPCPVRSIHMTQIVSDKWDAMWIDAMDKKNIFELILAANYLDIKCLIHLGCAKISTL
eukprot:470672_1